MSREQGKLAMRIADRLAALAQDLECEDGRKDDVILLGVAAGLLRNHAMIEAASDSRLKPLVETGTGSIGEADESGGARSAIAQASAKAEP